MKISKLSHGTFNPEQQDNLIRDKVISRYSDTGANQGSNFRAAPDGTLFYLTNGNACRRWAN